MATEIIIPVALGQLRDRFNDVAALVRDTTPLMKRYAVQVIREIDENFRVGGRPAWKPLAASTINARRKGSSLPLHGNTGFLARSWDSRIEPRELVVFSKSPKSRFHQWGTRGPYEIRPKQPGGVLAIPTGNYTKAGLAKSRPIGTRGTYQFNPGKRVPRHLKGRTGLRVLPYKSLAFVKSVTHPGLPPRPMLPTNEQIIPKLLEITNQYIAEQLVKRLR